MALDMNIRVASLALVVSVLAVGGGVTSSTAQSTPAADTPRVADEATKDVKYDPNGVKMPELSVNLEKQVAPKIEEPAPTLAETPSDVDALKLSPYIVKDMPVRTFERANEAMAQRKRLQTYAVYKRDVTPAVRAEFLNPPEEGTNGKANFPFFRLSW